MTNKPNVLLGMSGGTDSSVAAILLLQQGYDVTGITFRFWEHEGENQHLEDAAAFCGQLGIKHHIYDARDVFREKIIGYFVSEYLSGKTPFPCAKCNNELKWNLLLEEADRLGCEKVAMGHYANIIHDDGKFFITEGVDAEKDQSFFLWGLKQEQLARILFPLGKMHKTSTRKLAADHGFKSVAEKKDNLGACFCKGDYRPFLKSQLTYPEKHIFPGNYVDETGKVLGTHSGYPMFTVGQRRGLGIHLNKAVFVKKIDPDKNEITLAPLKDMYKTSFEIEDYNLVDSTLFSSDFDTIIRIRYRKQNTPGNVTILNDKKIKITLSEPLESIAPGQTAVFYRNGRVLGGGFIC